MQRNDFFELRSQCFDRGPGAGIELGTVNEAVGLRWRIVDMVNRLWLRCNARKLDKTIGLPLA